MVALHYVAVCVPDLREAERHYQEIFSVEVVGREVLGDDGRWYALRPAHGWDDLDAAGLEALWVGLRRDELVIALFPARQLQADHSLRHIGVEFDPDELAEIRSRLPDSVEVESDDADGLIIVDRHGIRWQLSGLPFADAGELRGDWLDL